MTYWKWLSNLIELEIEMLGHWNNLSRETSDLHYRLGRIVQCQ